MQKYVCLFILVFATHYSFAQLKHQTLQIDSIFTVLHDQNQFNGNVLIAEKGNIILTKSYGLRDETAKLPNNVNTNFELASSSKQFTAAAIVLLKRQGGADGMLRFTKLENGDIQLEMLEAGEVIGSGIRRKS
ncbi:beta-lactamase [Chitinophaga skermanii]|uniref:Beta-lactamase n=1 Tax=Chitinophaga skermanii TaxID=331697 RepID=A0A327QJ02_9BACT|nr:serine hydrolase domain-containing protein [Chitinophaga skermanii]RAJ04241.1 beta-lactamase [Chitinophaga skermanii]